MYFKSLNSISIKKNFKAALRSLIHSNNIKYKIIFYSDYRNPLNMNEYADNYINQIISEIMNQQIIIDNFPQKFIKDEVLLVLYRLHYTFKDSLNNENFDLIYEDLINKLELKIKNIIENDFENFEYFFHIPNLNISTDLKIGDVTLFKISEDLKKQDDFFRNEFFVIGSVYAKVIVFGSKKYALSKAEVTVKMALNILKLFLNDFISNFNLEGDEYFYTKRRYICKVGNNYGFGAYAIGLYDCCYITDCDLKESSFYLKILSDILKRKNRSDFENRLLTAIYWFGESLSVKTKSVNNKVGNKHENNIDNFEFYEVYPKLLNLVIALETLFVFGDENKSKAISSKVSQLIAKIEYQEEIELFLEEIYKRRSKIVHAGVIFISQEDLDKLTRYTRIAICHLIDYTIIYQDKINYLSKLHSKK